MGKFLVQGRDAGRVLNHISGNEVDGAAGVITYTQWLNEGGTLEADLTITKLAEDRYLVVVTDTMVRHAETWLRRHIPEDAQAMVSDVTSAYGQLNVQGPSSRSLLQKLTSTDLSNSSFPFRTAREIDLGFARVLCIRITYLGELGYELYIPAEQAVHVYDRIIAAGEEFGLAHAGLKALGSLRMEKGYRDYGHDIDNTDVPYEVGLGFALDLKKAGGFIGKEAVLAQKARGPLTRRLVQVLIKDPQPLMDDELIEQSTGREVYRRLLELRASKAVYVLASHSHFVMVVTTNLGMSIPNLAMRLFRGGELPSYRLSGTVNPDIPLLPPIPFSKSGQLTLPN